MPHAYMGTDPRCSFTKLCCCASLKAQCVRTLAQLLRLLLQPRRSSFGNMTVVSVLTWFLTYCTHVAQHTTWTEFVMSWTSRLSCHASNAGNRLMMTHACCFKTKKITISFSRRSTVEQSEDGLREHAMTSIPATIQHVIAKATFQLEVCWRST